MSVIDRLQRLTGEKQAPGKPGTGQAGGRVEEIRALRERIEAVLNRRPEARWTVTPAGTGEGVVPLEDLLPGSEVENAGGRFFYLHQVASGSLRHGSQSIRDLAPCAMDSLALLANDPVLRGRDYSEALFLDTETTGLAGGAGTVPFLIGLGWFDGDAFVTRQLFARDYSEERATLLCLSELVRGRGFLVSFNGKAFDANLLASRFILNRLADPLQGLPHLDLLHPARRLFSHRLADRRLSSLEAALLGFEREGDLPGSEIPERYFRWLRRRDGRLMADVFIHNRLDILSLAGLAAFLAQLVDPTAAGAGATGHHPGDRLAAARLCMDRSRPGAAISLLSPLMGCALPGMAREACREMSLLHKAKGEWPAAVALWEEMLRRNGEDLFALVELAKWYEHRCHDYGKALELTLEAAASAERTLEERASLAARRERLERKLAALAQNPARNGPGRPR